MRAAAGSSLAHALGAALCMILIHGPAHAALRVPQVAVQGSSLQTYLDGVGEQIDVHKDQQNIQVFVATLSSTIPLVLQLELGSRDTQFEIGVYDATQSGPVLVPLFPPVSGPGWFVVAAFRLNPTRLIVNVFDQNTTLIGTHTYLDANRGAITFYEQGPEGTFYTQDSRNPGAAPQVLVFAGTGSNSGSWWMAFERTSLGAGSDYDFDDGVVFLESVDVDPVQHASWGQVKARFR